MVESTPTKSHHKLGAATASRAADVVGGEPVGLKDYVRA